MSERQMRYSLRDSFSRENQHVLTLSLLRSMLPDGWDCPHDNGDGIQSDGILLRSSPTIMSTSNNGTGHNGNGNDDRLRMIRANRSIKISKLIPIVNSTRPERQMMMMDNNDGNGHGNNNSLNHSSNQLPPPSLSRQSSMENPGEVNGNDLLDYVYYFEVFLISGIFSVGFETDSGNNSSEIENGNGIPHIRGGQAGDSESIGLHVNGDLWLGGRGANNRRVINNWTQPFQKGDTIGCGVVVGSNAKYFFTRNGDEIEGSEGIIDFDCLRVSSIQNALIPCVGISPSTDTAIRTNFGFNSDYRFVWKGRENVRIICHTALSNGPSAANTMDDSIHSDDQAFMLPTDIVRGHTIGGDTRDFIVPPVISAEDPQRNSSDSAIGTQYRRRHSERLPPSRNGSMTGANLGLPKGWDIDSMDSLENNDIPQSSENNTNIRPPLISELGSPDMESIQKKIESMNTNVIPVLDLNDIRELARELRNATGASNAHNGALSPLIDVCKTNLEQLNETVQRSATGVDSGHDLGELLTVHEMVTDAIEAAEKKRTDMESDEKASRKKRDIFSLLCHLRGQKQKRYDAVWGLLGLTEKGTAEIRCHEIITSGGMQSLLTLFKTSSDSKELMMVSALTVVYLLPSLLDSDTPSSSYIHMGVIECLQFLIESSRESTGIGISPSEIRTSSAFAMTNLWFKVLAPKLRSTDIALANTSIKRFGTTMNESQQDPFGRRFFTRRQSSLSSQSGEDVDCSILIDSFTSLSVMAAESEASRQGEEEAGQSMNVYYEFALIVESICAVEYTRPMAMKEGVVKLLLEWLRSGDIDLERPAANALRNLTLTQDDYIAGWVHSQLLNENALIYIVGRLESNDSRVRLAMAEVISSLTVAPHTRAGIIEARGVKYLVQVLGSVDVQARDDALALAAGKALLRLAMGAVACTESTSGSFVVKRTFSKKDCIINDIVQNGALISLVSMAKAENYGALRALAAKILRVISEACGGHTGRGGTERELCDAEAVSALGRIMWNDVTFIRSSIENKLASSDTSDLINDELSNEFLTSMAGSSENIMNEMRHVLRALVNILRSSQTSGEELSSTTYPVTLLRACSQLITSGGVKSMLWIASMTQDARSKLEMIIQVPRFCHEIQIDSCQALASLCPLLLSPNVPTPGITKWAPFVLSALVNFLRNQNIARVSNGNVHCISPDIFVDVLQGLACLASWEPLKTRIIDEFMPHLLDLHRHESRNVSDAATQVCIALGFNEVESGMNDAYLLGDKFILARSSLVQAMLRDEIRQLMYEIWVPAFKEIPAEQLPAGLDHANEAEQLCLFFSTDQQDTAELRATVREQFRKMYERSAPNSQSNDGTTASALLGLRSLTSLGRKPMKRTMHRSGSYAEGDDFARFNQRKDTARAASTDRSAHLISDINMQSLSELVGNENGVAATSCDNNFLQCHQFPLNVSTAEKDWVIGHCQTLNDPISLSARSSPCLSPRVNDVLRVCFPSLLIRDKAIPLCGFTSDALFNFRALVMPSGRYYSFRREGQLISQECETLEKIVGLDCTMCFHNSSFAGEFTESLLQVLYLCPIIQGLSFSSDAVADENARTHKGSELLPFMARAIPSSVNHLTFDNVLSNNAAHSLAHIFKGAYDERGDEETIGSMSAPGSLQALAIINSSHINQAIFSSLVESINSPSSPLQFLTTLDLSGNLLGDKCSAEVLSVALSSASNSIQRLDLSRNGIGEGNAVKRVLEECASNDPKLNVLNMSHNNIGEGEGELASQIAASLVDVFAKLVAIDLSGNGLSGSFLIILGTSLSSNSHLVNLDISNNQFGSSSINSFFSKLHNMSKSNVSTRLSFVHLRGNAPPLAHNQEMVLDEILSANRSRILATFLEEQSTESDSDTNSSPRNQDSVQPMSNISDMTRELNPEKKTSSPETITVLFSAPLVWRDGENAYHPIEMLDFQLEKSLLWQCFSEASRNIDLSYDNATTDRLQAVMTRGCKCLHFSGHGHPYCLTFEDGSGGIHWFSVDQLKALISGGLGDGKPPFQFVFVSACHSALAGQTFVDSGVPHVVCCQQESQLMDRAALSFTRAFYLALAFGRTLKESFEIGKHAVLSSATVLNPQEEMEKFMLLPEDGNHDIPIFNAEEVPGWPLPQQNGTRKALKSDVNDTLPSPPQGFLGRETDMYHALNLVLNRRFVNIVGPTGMGRSSLAAALCHYIDERKSTLLFDDIYFVKTKLKRPVVGKNSPIISLHSQLVSARKVYAMSEEKDLDEIIQEILASLKQTKSLIVFEKIEALDGTTDAQDLQFFLGQIFEQTKDVHVLVTSNKSIGLSPLLNVGESVHNLGPLNFRNTVKFFAFHCPHLHSSRERKELLEELASHTLVNRLAEDDEVSEKIKSVLGGGIPAKIFAVAYEMTAEKFQELKSMGKERETGNSENTETNGIN